MRLYKLMSVFILATATENGLANNYYQSNSTTWKNITCDLGEPQLTYHDRFFEINETVNISDDVWIGYLYVQVPFLLLGCLQSENGVYVKEIGYCFTICRGGTFGIKKTHILADFLCICVTEYSEKNGSSCKGGDQNRLCDGCYEIYTQINVNASHVIGSDNGSGGDCLTYYYPNFKWQPCSRPDFIPSLCSNATYADPKATATIIVEHRNGQWSTGNKLCITNGLHPSFVRSITNSVFGDPQRQDYWTGIIRSNILMKLSMKDLFSRFSTERYVFLSTSNNILQVSNNADTKRALCVKGSESTSQHTQTSIYTTTVGAKSSLPTTQMFTTLETDYDSPASNEGRHAESGNTQSEMSTALRIGIGVLVGVLFLVGGALVLAVLKRRGILYCIRKTGNNTHFQDETAFKENMTYGKNIEDNVAQHNYFILEKCALSISNNVDHCNESNKANVNDNYNTIYEAEEPYEHVKDESSDYDHTTPALQLVSHTSKPENVYNKLKMDRPGENVLGQRHGHIVVQSSEDDYNTTSAVMSLGKDDVSDYNHIPHNAYKAATTDDEIKGDNGGNYNAINSMKLTVAQSDDSDYAHVNKNRIK
ncbi:uncharacterized protein LOC127881548 isoform X7 [Dreissena polymorpha]|uniref:uncharacterized protein LOC127881548 isoform X7 n=1 Tax=Dreissena polymorpha TaxID=45954 RepID=UPI0022640A20|nr:uncharacterized protein LOC127881548 isoform X7 [Dreissena polymorpha]